MSDPHPYFISNFLLSQPLEAATATTSTDQPTKCTQDLSDDEEEHQDDERMSEYVSPEQDYFRNGRHTTIPSSPTANADLTAVRQNTMPAAGPSQASGSRRRRSVGYRAERNAREKERSFRITQQIEELRQLLHDGGVVVPKSTKGTILSATIRYIKSIQRQQKQEQQKQPERNQHQPGASQQQHHNSNMSPVVSSVAVPTHHHGGTSGAVPSRHTTAAPSTATVPSTVPDPPHVAAMTPIVQAAIAGIMPLLVAGTATTPAQAEAQAPSFVPPAVPTTEAPAMEGDFVAHFESCQFGMVSIQTVRNGWSWSVLRDTTTHTQFPYSTITTTNSPHFALLSLVFLSVYIDL